MGVSDDLGKMKISVKCPNCGAINEISIKDLSEKDQIKCVSCNTVFVPDKKPWQDVLDQFEQLEKSFKNFGK